MYIKIYTKSQLVLLRSVNCYPQKLKIGDDIEGVFVSEKHTWMTEGKEWYMDTMKIKGEKAGCTPYTL